MSFRGRLTLFFLLIVVLPMIAVSVFVLQVSANSETGKADARLAASLDSSLAVYRDQLNAADGRLRDIATDPRITQALTTGDTALASDAARQLRAAKKFESLEILDADGQVLAREGGWPAFAAARINIRGPNATIGSVVGSVTTPTGYVSRTKELTGRDTIVDFGGKTATTIPIGGLALPAPNMAETVDLNGKQQRAASALLTGGVGSDPTATVIAPLEESGLAGTRPLIFAAVAVFFLVALAFIAILLRALNAQTGAMLDAARRIGGGDFSREVPVEGNDEMAGLAREFNKMSDRLESQMAALRHQRVELEASVRRIGDAFASGLDRPAVLQIVAETAISACAAEYARIRMPGLERPIEAGEAVGNGEVQEASEPTGSGSITISRGGEAFDAEEREVLRYLAAQASTSIENINLHDQVSEQAVTDELTGLANNRALQRWLDTEAERAVRFGHELSLLILDLDDFKRVNDTYGHLQGDEVLRVIGRLLMEESRGIDEPARYGGEEFAVGLPETGTQGATEVAERIRSRMADEQVPMVEGEGSMSVTVSIGVAAVPESAEDVRGLFSAADQALYRAKAAGKNRVERFDSAGEEPAKGPTTARRS